MVTENETSATRGALLEQLSAPLRRFLSTEAGSAGLLAAAALLALLLANSPWSSLYESFLDLDASFSFGGFSLGMNLEHWVNDGLMAVFFFVVGLEVRREFSVGELTDARRVAVPMLAAIGGIIVPALIYLAFNPSGEAAHGWGVVIGTDTAFMLGALALVGPRFSTQLRIFLLVFTVIDDIAAVSVIGLVYSDGLRPAALVLTAVMCGVIWLLSRLGVWRSAPYVLAGVGLWLAAYEAGLHGSIAGMLGGLLIGAHEPARDAVEQAAKYFRAFRQSPRVEVGRTARQGLQQAVSINERMQLLLHPWTGYVIVPLFAFANAGVDLRGGILGQALSSPVTWGVICALVLGKLVGVGGSSLLAFRLGAGRPPQGVGKGHILSGAALSGIGFTVSLLIAGLAFDDQVLRDEAVVGVLLSVPAATAIGWLLFQVSARFLGEGDADLPRVLDRPVDPAVDHIRGRPDAPLTLVEYGDFECPFCAKATGVARELRERFGPELRYVFRHLPLADVHPHAELAARAAVAAGFQDRFWEMHDLLFAHRDELEYEDIAGYAADLGLDVERLLRDLDEERTADRVRADIASAEASGARGTPTFFVGDRRHTGPFDAHTLALALEASRTP